MTSYWRIEELLIVDFRLTIEMIIIPAPAYQILSPECEVRMS